LCHCVLLSANSPVGSVDRTNRAGHTDLANTHLFQQKPSNLKELDIFYFEEWAKIPVARCDKLIEA